MLFFSLLFFSIPFLINAQGTNPPATPTPNPPGPPAPPVSNPPGPPAPSGPGTVTSAATTSTRTFPSVSVSLLSTNPTAVPLTFITANQSSTATIPLSTIYPAGAQPTAPSGAPPLPPVTTTGYPPLDTPAPYDTPQVQQWWSDVQNSGISIPTFGQTNTGGCPNNTAILNDPNRCWWTCGGCNRSTDVTTCPDKYTWGLTYDDGPGFYTPNLLAYLKQVNLKATLFVIGSRVAGNPNTLRCAYMDGHQIGVHTWSHFPLTTLPTMQIVAELGWSKKIIKDNLGITPNMMRPPYGDIDDRVRAISVAMGLTPVIWTRLSPFRTFDTEDFNIQGGSINAPLVLQNWEWILGNVTMLNTGFIVLEHDLFLQSVDLATGYILPDALAHQPAFKIEPVITCLGKPLSDAYIETNDNKSNTPIQSIISAGGLTKTFTAAATATGNTKSGEMSLFDAQVYLQAMGVAVAGLMGGAVLL